MGPARSICGYRRFRLQEHRGREVVRIEPPVPGCYKGRPSALILLSFSPSFGFVTRFVTWFRKPLGRPNDSLHRARVHSLNRVAYFPSISARSVALSSSAMGPRNERDEAWLRHK